MSSKYNLPAAPLLLLVTDRTRYGDRTLEDIFIEALSGGVNMIELREADMTARDQLGEAERLRKPALGGVPLIVYHRIDVAVAATADGAPVSTDRPPVPAAKHAGCCISAPQAVSPPPGGVGA